MAAQHKRPGRSAKRRRQERALIRLEARLEWAHRNRPQSVSFDEGANYLRWLQSREQEAKALRLATSAPLLPVPAKQSRKLVR